MAYCEALSFEGLVLQVNLHDTASILKVLISVS